MYIYIEPLKQTGYFQIPNSVINSPLYVLYLRCDLRLDIVLSSDTPIPSIIQAYGDCVQFCNELVPRAIALTLEYNSTTFAEVYYSQPQNRSINDT
jgi:hypothetical protein